MKFLTVIDPSAIGVQIQYEVKNLLLREPRITVTCAAGTNLMDIRIALQNYGWDTHTYDAWFDANGRQFLEKGVFYE